MEITNFDLNHRTKWSMFPKRKILRLLYINDIPNMICPKKTFEIPVKNSHSHRKKTWQFHEFHRLSMNSIGFPMDFPWIFTSSSHHHHHHHHRSLRSAPIFHQADHVRSHLLRQHPCLVPNLARQLRRRGEAWAPGFRERSVGANNCKFTRLYSSYTNIQCEAPQL